jgi:formylglycine-generating enzyme required for sulfatase activity
MKMAERRFGILIASSTFPEDPKLEDLRYPENDVQGLKIILASKDRGGFSDIKTFVNAPHYEILPILNRTLKSADKSDLVLIYYSGHGKLNSTNRLHLTTTNTDAYALESTSISIGGIRELVDVSSTKKVILILDCCYSGAGGAEFVKVRGGVDDQLQLASRGRGMYIMTASTGVQVALEKEADQHGIFTKHLIEGIRSGNADLDEDGLISMAELYRYVHGKVLDECHQEPTEWAMGVRGELFIARSGKKPREERKQQLRSILFDMAREGLPDNILTKALEIIALKPDQVTGTLKDYDNLLEKLYNKSIKALQFVYEWNQINRNDSGKDIAPPRSAEKPAPKPKRKPKKRKLPDIKRLLDAHEGKIPFMGAPENEITNDLGMRFVYIPPGTFVMGSPDDEPERFEDEKQHQVTLTKGFYMQTTEVSQGQWQEVMGSNPSYFKECGNDCPVEKVSWYDAQDFIEKLNAKEDIGKYRLPTEAEWEYAARAGTQTPFFFGRCLSTDQANYNGNYPLEGCPKGKYRETTLKVGSLQPNAWGLFDMHGNVWEWCEDYYGNYPDSKELTDPIGPSKGSHRVVRGGGWAGSAGVCRSAFRGRFAPVDRGSNLGFRLVLFPGQQG